jgi:hypothetical protein
MSVAVLKKRNLRRPNPESVTPAVMALSSAAKASPGKWPIAPTGIIGRDDTGCVAARAVDVQLQAVVADVTDRLEWKCAEHGANRNAAPRLESLCQQ